jgi:hypothetical protein
MEEQELVVSQVFERNSDNIPSARAVHGRVLRALRSGGPALVATRLRGRSAHSNGRSPYSSSEPGVRLGAPCSTSAHDTELPRGVPQVERRVGVMTNPEKEHLPIQIVHTTGRAFGDVGRRGSGSEVILAPSGPTAAKAWK